MQKLILNQRLKELLGERKITASELSRRTNISRQVISDWLAGVHPRNLAQLKLIADAFSITLESLCFGAREDCRDLASDAPEVFVREGIYELRVKKIK